MKKLSYLSITLLLFSCGNAVEEITDPTTGTVLKRYEYYTDGHGQKVKDGSYTEWNNDGTIKWTCNFQDGIQQGEEKLYLTQDSIIYNNFKDGIREGSSKVEYKGVVIRELNFSDGTLNGKQRYYHNNGKLSVEGYMYKNLTTKVWKHYDPKGKLIATFNYNEWYAPKELIGKWVQQTDDGSEFFYIFDESGNAEYHEPFNKFHRKALLELKGALIMGVNLLVTDGRKQIALDIVSYEKDKLVVKNRVGETKIFLREK